MTDMLASLFGAEITPLLFILIVFVTLVASSIHGATGVAGGFLASAALAPIVGVEIIVPLISISLLISHTSRALLNRRAFDKRAYLIVMLPAVPLIIIGAMIYSELSAHWIAVLLGGIILGSIPIRRLAQRMKKKVGRLGLGVAGAVYGGLSGASIGPGMLLVPFMMGYGLSREAFVATLAAVALTTNITRLGVYGAESLIEWHHIILGLVIGLITIPGNWIGRSLLRRMTNAHHANFVDILTIIGAGNFFWLAHNAWP